MNVGRRLPIQFVFIASGLSLAACGSADGSTTEISLPPINTTTTIAKSETTASPYTQFYKLKPGESIRQVADAFNVPYDILIKVNEIDNPDKVPVGMRIEIPPAREIDDLPADSPSTTTP